jgi:hypothetical protein
MLALCKAGSFGCSPPVMLAELVMLSVASLEVVAFAAIAVAVPGLAPRSVIASGPAGHRPARAPTV